MTKKKVSRVVEKKQQKQVDDVIAYKALFGSPDGKRVLNDLIRTCGMLNATYAGDPNEVIFREGQRAIVVRILNILKIDPSRLQKNIEDMRKEEESYHDFTE